MIRILRFLLFPLSLVYGGITAIRNWLYDREILPVFHIPVKSITVGNLSTGGTGKTPHVALLTEYYAQKLPVAILSRGYGRKTRGFREVLISDQADDTGDEPLLYKLRFADQVRVFVCEDRRNGIVSLLEKYPETALIILDDAFQHRKVQAGFSILLTTFQKPFFRDLPLPAGNLREFSSGKKRADLCILTKTPQNTPELTKEKLRKRTAFPPQKAFCSSIVYGKLLPFSSDSSQPARDGTCTFLIVSGIADPAPLQEYWQSYGNTEAVSFPDHHDFTEGDIQRIHEKFDTFAGPKAIITTEKDLMRLRHLNNERTEMNKYPWFYQSISIEIENKEHFFKQTDHYVGTI